MKEREQIKNKIVEKIKYYKEEIEEYEDFLENSMEDGEANTSAETSIDRIEEFIYFLEELERLL
jgi:hypothetical protein|nr:MAG TPA: hypothetical protein [Caudoviricetes sp.]